MSLAMFAIGLLCGIAIGAWNGRDLGMSVGRITGEGGKGRIIFGLVRRTALLAVALVGALWFGTHAWVGVAAGYLLGFSFVVRREVRAHGV